MGTDIPYILLLFSSALLLIASILLLVFENMSMIRLKGALFEIGWVLVRCNVPVPTFTTRVNTGQIFVKGGCRFRFVNPYTCYFIFTKIPIARMTRLSLKGKLVLRNGNCEITGTAPLATLVFNIAIACVVLLGLTLQTMTGYEFQLRDLVYLWILSIVFQSIWLYFMVKIFKNKYTDIRMAILQAPI